jgi:hypothetical protein
MARERDEKGLPVTVGDHGDHLIGTAVDPEIVNPLLLVPGMRMTVGERGELIVEPPTADDVLAAPGVPPDGPAEVRDAAIVDGWGDLFPPERDALEAAGLAPRAT